jgi:hypothetical protein
MSLDIQLERIEDEVVRESFQKVIELVRANPFLAGSWRVYEQEFKSANPMAPIKHNLTFTPQDALLLSISDGVSFEFQHDRFDKNYLYADVGGPCRVRFIAGRVSK